MQANYDSIRTQVHAPMPDCIALIQALRVHEIDPRLPFAPFFTAFKACALKAWDFSDLQKQDSAFSQISLAELQSLQESFYQELHPKAGYESSLANPDFAAELFPADFAPLFSAVYLNARQIRNLYLLENFLSIRSILQLYFDLYALAAAQDLSYPNYLACYRHSLLEHQDIQNSFAILQRYSPQHDFNRNIVLNADLSDLRYLYRFGIYVDENALELARFIQTYDPTELHAIAQYIVKSFIDGFIRGQKDYRIKRFATVMIPLGMEALSRQIIRELENLGLEALLPPPLSRGINRQLRYDHRFDFALTFDADFMEKSLESTGKAYEAHQELIAHMAGPLYVELFGEVPFSPVAKNSCLKLSAAQQKLYQEHSARSAQLHHRYARRHESSFTIIAFPSPEIGDHFQEIFADTLRINLLDSDLYANIQQHIIDVLDTAKYVHVKGKAGNDTDIKVQMYPLTDAATQTIFENCVADVNIPVGEVFTSPKLEGTTGTLHVEDIYLGNLRYFNLKMHFEDGWVKDYSCTNFPDPAEGKRYIHENLLLPHDSLPLGEFAIGTNTTAYQIAKKYDIMHLLPILIIEKMGPHFAIGDTCYSHEEEQSHPNFLNNKEMIAVENEKSALRHSDPLQAYTQKHTDITLPYEMLESITAVRCDGSQQDIIRNGRFVVPGTEELNIPLDEI